MLFLLIATPITIFALSYILKFSGKWFRQRLADEPPLVGGSVLWGSAAEFSRDAVSFLHQQQKIHGGVFSIRLLHLQITMVASGGEVWRNINNNPCISFHPVQTQVNKNVFNFQLHDCKQLVKRTVIAFKDQNLKNALKIFVENVEESLNRLTQSSIELCGEQSLRKILLRSFTADTLFHSIFISIFGASEDVFKSRYVFENFETFHQYFNFLWLGAPIYIFPKAMIALRQLMKIPDSSVLLEREDLCFYLREAIAFMLQTHQTEGDIKGHNLVFLHVNYNTFRVAYWCLYFMMADPVVEEELRKEVKGKIRENRNKETGEVVVDESIIRVMPVLDSVFLETCRLTSGVFVVREVLKDTWVEAGEMGRYRLRGGDKVAFYPPSTHKDPSIFPHPLKFKYDRFLEGKRTQDGKLLSSYVTPFGSLCPGSHYATLQVKLYIIAVLNRFEVLEKESGVIVEPDLKYNGHEILPPKNDVEITFKSRKNVCKLSFQN